MTIDVITDNTAAQNATPDNLYTGTETVYLKEGTPTVNKAGISFEVTKYGSGDHANGLLRFDLTNVPTGVTVSSALLYLRQSGSTGTHTIDLREILQTSWVNAQTTWDDYNTGNAWNTGGAQGVSTDVGPVISSTVIDGVLDYHSFSCTSIVQANLGGSAEFHLQRQGTGNDSTFKVFRGSTNTNTLRPELVITYTTPSSSLTQADTTPEDGVLQSFTTTGLSGSITAATLGGYDILSLLSNTDPTTATTYTLDISAIEASQGAPRIGETSTLIITATGGAPTTDVVIQPATDWTTVTLAGTLDKTANGFLATTDTDLGITTAVGDIVYYSNARGESITATGVYTGGSTVAYESSEFIIQQGGSATTTATSEGGAFFPFGTGPVAPVLTLPTSASITKTGATIGCTTNENAGTMYFYISTNSSETSGTITASGESQTVSTSGIQTRALTGLTVSTNYYGHMVHIDSDVETSNVISTAQFTTLANDTTPDQFDLGVNVTNAELNANTKRSFISAGLDESITWTATGTGTVSLTLNGGYGATVDAGNGIEIFFQLSASSSFATLTTGGVTAGGVSDSINVTTRAELIPVIDATRSAGSLVNVSFAITLVTTGGDPVDTWAITGGADQAQYNISGSVAARTANRTTAGTEVFNVTATNTGGTSDNTQVITVTYSEPSEVKGSHGITISSIRIGL